MQLKKGDIVRLRRKKWEDPVEMGILLGRAYHAYENQYSRWTVLVNGEVREVWEKRLFRDKRVN